MKIYYYCWTINPQLNYGTAFCLRNENRIQNFMFYDVSNTYKAVSIYLLKKKFTFHYTQHNIQTHTKKTKSH